MIRNSENKILCIRTTVPVDIEYNVGREYPIYIWESENEPKIGAVALSEREEISQDYIKWQEEKNRQFKEKEQKAYEEYSKSCNGHTDMEEFFNSHFYPSDERWEPILPPAKQRQRQRVIVDICWKAEDELKKELGVDSLGDVKTAALATDDPDGARKAYVAIMKDKEKYPIKNNIYACKFPNKNEHHLVEVAYMGPDGKPYRTMVGQRITFLNPNPPEIGQMVMLSDNVENKESALMYFKEGELNRADEPNTTAIVIDVLGETTVQCGLRHIYSIDSYPQYTYKAFTQYMQEIGKEHKEEVQKAFSQTISSRKQLNMKGILFNSSFFGNTKFFKENAYDLERMVTGQNLDANASTRLRNAAMKDFGYDSWLRTGENILNYAYGMIYTTTMAHLSYEYGIQDINALDALYVGNLLKKTKYIDFDFENVIKNATRLNGKELVDTVFTENKEAICNDIDIILDNFESLSDIGKFIFPNDWDKKSCWMEIKALINEIDKQGPHKNYKEIGNKLEDMYATRDIKEAIEIEKENYENIISKNKRHNRNRGIGD